MSSPITIISVERQEQVLVARELFREYTAAIGVDLKYQGFTAELADLPSPYLQPYGALFLATVNDDVAGCAAMRSLDLQTGELKRLYVRAQYRSWGIAKHLIGEVIQAARRAGYTALRLDTLPSMVAAQRLYSKLGFVEIPPYNDTHLPGTRFYELDLSV